MYRWFQPPKIARSVENGRVHCPVRFVDMDVERCFSCAFLGSVARDDEGGLGQITCQPTFRALLETAAP